MMINGCIAKFAILGSLMVLSSAAHADPVRINLPAAPDLEQRLSDALARAVPGEEITLPASLYNIHDEITIDQPGVTLQGQGKGRTLLEFSQQKAGAQRILGTANGIVLQD